MKIRGLPKFAPPLIRATTPFFLSKMGPSRKKMDRTMSRGHIASRTGVAGLLLVLMNVFALAAFAQSTPPAPSASAGGLDETEDAATVRYFNRDIYTLRVPYRGRSARERAIGAEQNLARAVAEVGKAQVGSSAFRRD